VRCESIDLIVVMVMVGSYFPNGLLSGAAVAAVVAVASWEGCAEGRFVAAGVGVEHALSIKASDNSKQNAVRIFLFADISFSSLIVFIYKQIPEIMLIFIHKLTIIQSFTLSIFKITVQAHAAHNLQI
jgi:hypothetical protein